MDVNRFISHLLLIVLLVSCGHQSRDAEKRVIAVTIEPLKYFVEELSGGDFEASVVVPSGSSPESFEPTPSVMRDVADSKAYISIGLLDCEIVINSSLGDVVKKVELYRGVDCIGADNHHHHEHGEHCSHTGFDPHFWVSVGGARSIAKQITALLQEINSDSTAKYRAAYDRFSVKLDSLDCYICNSFESRSKDQFVVYHPALAYLAREYNLEQIPIEHEGKEPTISTLKNVIDLVENMEVKYILHQAQHDRRAAEVIASQTGCKIIDFDPLLEHWYSNMMTIADGVALSIR